MNVKFSSQGTLDKGHLGCLWCHDVFMKMTGETIVIIIIIIIIIIIL